MQQWVGILLGFIVVVALVLAYMYRSSNFEVAPPNTISSAPSGAPLVEAPAQAPVTPAPAPAPSALPPVPVAPPVHDMAPAPMPAANFSNTTPIPPAQPAPPAAPSMGVSTYAPDPMAGDFEPAYEGEYAEIDDNNVPESQ